MSLSEISSGGQTSIWKISTGGQKSTPKISFWGQMFGLHFQVQGKCPLIDLLIWGQMSWGAYVLESLFPYYMYSF